MVGLYELEGLFQQYDSMKIGITIQRMWLTKHLQTGHTSSSVVVVLCGHHGGLKLNSGGTLALTRG